ncbi:hypothetical protein ACIPVB_10350 [Microbacterium sp. NPDC090007]|uniref:hypothetical protein n=1 Tax=Microbacterium sp. NPDC090007 TaxID=3364204 RepID=UPI0038278AFB
MRRQARATRVLRGTVAAVVSTFVALLSHVSAGGALPGPIGILVPLAVSFVACTVLTGRRLSVVRLAAAVALSQALFHTLFVLGSYELGGAGGHVHGVSAPVSTGAAEIAVLAPDLAMWVGHAIAVLLTTAALHRGERVLAAVRELAHRTIAWVRARVAVVAVAARPASSRRMLPDVVAETRPVSVLLVVSARRRGPPVAIA